MPIEFAPEILEKLKNTRKQLEQDEKPNPDSYPLKVVPINLEKLKGYYRLFKEKFGPDVLKNLEGEELLENIHGRSSKESLVYWLEFKDDEEFPGRMFGSIAGGTALKFGIYKKTETGEWMTGYSIRQKVSTLEEAIRISEKQRNQFVRGAELIASLPESADLEQYKKLQQNLDKECPDIANTAWGHKYFSLLFPDKLDDFHVPDYQKFHLIKLGIIPDIDKGRFIAGYYFTKLAKELGVPIVHLTTIIKSVNGNPYKYWKIGTRISGGTDSIWQDMRDSNFVAIGWSRLGDLSNCQYNIKGKNRIKELVEEHYPGAPTKIGQTSAKIFKFINHIQKGDLVIVSDGKTALGIGRVTGDYEYVEKSEFPHRRSAKWLSKDEWEIPNEEGVGIGVSELKKHPENLIEVERKIEHGIELVDIIDRKIVSKPDHLTGISARIQQILDRKKQVILYGPPGTGKTYHALDTVRELASRMNYNSIYEQLDDSQKSTLEGINSETQYIRFCCFHPEYGYENFIEGYRPTHKDGKIYFELRDGIFKQICKDASRQKDKSFFLIIDEINRGDIPRIFGELITLIEADKREQSLQLPVSGESFCVPANVFIVGTMNTADRSIALLDTALRRRFGFIELMPDVQVLDNIVIEGIPLRLWLQEINRKICENIGQNGRNLQIGHSYFMTGGSTINKFPHFLKVIREDVIPLLEEYCYEDYDLLSRILGNSLVDHTNWRIKHELFDEQDLTSIANALMEPFPDISTSDIVIEQMEESIDEDEENETEDEDMEADVEENQ